MFYVYVIDISDIGLRIPNRLCLLYTCILTTENENQTYEITQRVSIEKTYILISIFLQHPLYRKGPSQALTMKENQSLPVHSHYFHDIAIVELADSINHDSPYTRPICLPPVGGNQFDNTIGKREELDGFRNKRHADYDSYNDVNLYDIERKGECWVTGWGETKGS